MRRKVKLAVASLLCARLSLLAGDEPAEKEPEKEPGIQDNSFFIEEAYNQEPGVVQSILTAGWSRFRQLGVSDDTFELAFTQEWPVSGVAHQLSYTVPFRWLRGDQPDARGFGDVLLNYRYQALLETPSWPAFAPRFSLAIPTGDEDKGLGTGVPGYQVNLPLSKGIGDLFYVHLNAGATFTPGVQTDLPGGGRSRARDLLDYRFGFSFIYLLRNDFNLLLEVFAARLEEIEAETGSKGEVRQMVLSPGARYAVNFKGGAQMVLGAAFPLGLTSESDDFGALLYLSFEKAFWKPGSP